MKEEHLFLKSAQRENLICEELERQDYEKFITTRAQIFQSINAQYPSDKAVKELNEQLDLLKQVSLPYTQGSKKMSPKTTKDLKKEISASKDILLAELERAKQIDQYIQQKNQNKPENTVFGGSQTNSDLKQDMTKAKELLK